MNIQEAVSRCRAVCGAEAMALGYPAEMGYTIHDDSIRHELEGWTDEEFLVWVHAISEAFGVKDWQPLYRKVAEVMNQYGRMVES